MLRFYVPQVEGLFENETSLHIFNLMEFSVLKLELPVTLIPQYLKMFNQCTSGKERFNYYPLPWKNNIIQVPHLRANINNQIPTPCPAPPSPRLLYIDRCIIKYRQTKLVYVFIIIVVCSYFCAVCYCPLLPLERNGLIPYKPYRYMLPQRVWFLHHRRLKMGINFAHFGMESGMVF